jgi:predicted dehydrogenase
MMIEAGVGGGDAMQITPWRHSKLHGGITLDMGVHQADLMRYFLGEAESAAGSVRLLEPVRHRTADGGPGGFYSRWNHHFPQTVRATAEDALWATVRFRSGPVAQWTYNSAGRGLGLRQRLVYGSEGSIAAPGDRTGRPDRLYKPGRPEIVGDAVLEHAPSYRLCGLAAQLFGSERPASYSLRFQEIDRKLVALEYEELGRCVLQGSGPEVGGEDARRDVALVYAVCESSLANRFVALDEVEELRVDAYQHEIDADLGLVEVPGLD